MELTIRTPMTVATRGGRGAHQQDTDDGSDHEVVVELTIRTPITLAISRHLASKCQHLCI